MFGLNQEQLLALVRDVLRIGGTVLVTLGVATAGQVESLTTALLTIIPAIAAIAGVVWGLLNKTETNMIASAAAQPSVTRIEVNTAAMANSITAPEVVPNAAVRAGARAGVAP